MSGMLQSIGKGIGLGIAMSIVMQTEIRPVLRKRLLANLFFLGWTLWGAGKAFSIQPIDPVPHFFILAVERMGITGTYDWMFTHVAITFGLTALAAAFWTSADRKAFDLSLGGNVVTLIAMALVAYASVYDGAYYLFGNNCTVLSVGCLNFANQAHYFALGSYIVYLLSSMTVLRPGEHGMLGFCVWDVRELKGGGTYFTPTAPLPHTLRVLSQIAFDLILGMWDIYVHPDGRERATQLNVK